MSEYDDIVKGPLRIKSDTNNKSKEKKNGKKKKMLQDFSDIAMKIEEMNTLSGTKAELTLRKMQEKVQMDQIKQRASLSHKQRVEAFNRHLESLSDHFDISKVSWTK